MRDDQGRLRLRTKPDEARDFVEQWIATPELRELVEADSGTWPTGELDHVLAELETFSEAWDFRGGQSRLIFKEGDESRTDERAQRIYKAARALGLLDPPPPSIVDPDYLVILGGLATGVQPRVRYAAELLADGTVTTDHVVALGSFRQLHDRERPVAATYAPQAENELDLLVAVMAEAFRTADEWYWTGLGDPAEDPDRASVVCQVDGVPALHAYASASSDPDHRPANTADTYEQFAGMRRLKIGQAVLLVTSSIYAPFQHLDAARVLGLGHGVEVETIGVPATNGMPSHPPSGYLQEVRSGLRSARLLVPPAVADWIC